ncbi:MAG TPA: dual specificity protein phosphatase family protein [Candidatus Saccharimonadales bacterium]|nr:dual specificity protein phosphatase family protein [Candidatus Saccharimonadales bacterium]
MARNTESLSDEKAHRRVLWLVLRHGKWVLLATILCPLFLGFYALYIYKKNNFHILTPGKAYRSAQLDKQALKDCIRDFGIKTILNLRESAKDAGWYTDEKSVAAEHGVNHIDVNLSEYDEVPVEELDKIATLLRDAPKPVLIHCAAGADRTGLVSALYRYKLEGLAPEKSFAELSMWYGHVPLLRNKVLAMDNSFWRYVTNDLKKAPLVGATIATSVLPSNRP